MSTDGSHRLPPSLEVINAAVTPAPTESSHTTQGDEGLDDLMLKWEDHHKSFFELAEDLCHSEQFIDVTISCGEHNFPAHKLILSVCSPYFKNLFLRNPCKHPIVVLKDVHFKYMKFILIFMYRGEVAVPQEDLGGLLKVARSLQVRGLAEMTPTLNPAAAVSPRKRYLSEMMVVGEHHSDVDSAGGGEFSIDDVKSRLHGQLEIQAVSVASPGSLPRTPPLPWGKYLAHSQFDDLQPGHRSSRSESGPSEEDPSSQVCKREVPDSWQPDSGSEDHLSIRENGKRHRSQSGGRDDSDLVQDYKAMLKRDRSISLEEMKREKPGGYLAEERARSGSLEDRMCSSSSDMEDRNTPIALIKTSSMPSNAGLIEAARAAGLDLQSNKNGDPMSSISALLAAAQATGGLPQPPISSSPSSLNNPASTTTALAKGSTASTVVGGRLGTTTTNASSTPTSAANQGLDLSNPAAAMANVNAQMQLYYYMQKLQTAGMGNPKERKECPICNKTLYDRSTWNRHMRIHTGEKPYPCTFCGRRFRTNYNKLGHEKKCPDRHARALLQPSGQPENGASSIPTPSVPQPTVAAVPNAVYR